MRAITAALSQIDRVAAEGDLAPDRAASLELETAGEPILLPDGKRIYPPCLHGQPIDELAVALLDMQEPAQSTFLRLIGPPGAGKSQIARAIAYRLWTGRGREVAERHGAPFYGFVELQPGPSSDEFFFRYDYVPVAGNGGQVRAGRFRVRAGDARGVGGDDRRGQHRPRRRAALDQRHARRTPDPVPRRDGGHRGRAAGVRGAARLQPGAGRRDRYPRRLAFAVPGDARGHEQLGGARATRRASGAGRRGEALDRQRIAGEDGLCWTPQFRDIESLWRMSERVGERAALAFFASNLHEQVQAGRSRTPRRRPRAGCSTRPATAVCGSRPAAACRTCTAIRGRSPS